MALRTGIAVLTLVVKHLCHILTTWRPSIDATIANAVSAGTITSSQAATVKQFLDLGQAACDVLRLVSGY